MEVQKALVYNSRSTTSYAIITRNKSGHEVWIGNSPWYRLPWQEDIVLKDVEYNIIEGILYIKGTQIFYYNFPNLLEIVTLWGKRFICTIYQINNSKLAEPFLETDVVIRRWWWFNKTIKGIDLTGQPIQQWYISKEENPCDVALSNFKLVEAWKESTED